MGEVHAVQKENASAGDGSQANHGDAKAVMLPNEAFIEESTPHLTERLKDIRKQVTEYVDSSDGTEETFWYMHSAYPPSPASGCNVTSPCRSRMNTMDRLVVDGWERLASDVESVGEDDDDDDDLLDERQTPVTPVEPTTNRRRSLKATWKSF